jgi:AICAR transformylase/IMP cyclohydrolase PurH
VAILKHTNPCGVASADTLIEAWDKAYATDRQAPFGGIIIVNQTLGEALAETIAEIFTEVIIAPRFSEALAIFAKKKNLRLMIAKERPRCGRAAGNALRRRRRARAGPRPRLGNRRTSRSSPSASRHRRSGPR